MSNDLIKVEGAIDSFVELEFLEQVFHYYKSNNEGMKLIPYLNNSFPLPESKFNRLFVKHIDLKTKKMIQRLSMNMTKLMNTSISMYGKLVLMSGSNRVIRREVHPDAIKVLTYVISILPKRFVKRKTKIYVTEKDREIHLVILIIKEQSISFLEKKHNQLDKVVGSGISQSKLKQAIQLLREQTITKKSDISFDEYLEDWATHLANLDISELDFSQLPKQRQNEHFKEHKI